MEAELQMRKRNRKGGNDKPTAKKEAPIFFEQ